MIQTLKLKAKRINKEVDIDIENIQFEDGTSCEVITHESLEKIIWDLKIPYEYNCVKAEMTHAVVECSMERDGLKIVKLGESILRNLVGISKHVPVSMAYKRAFDNAAIAILGLPEKYGKTLESVIETRTDENSESENEFLAEANKAAKETLNSIKEAPKTDVEPIKEEKEESKSSEKATTVENVEPKDTPFTTPDDVSENTPTYDDITVSFGPCKGMKISEILALPEGDEKLTKIKNLIGKIDAITNVEQKKVLSTIKSLIK